MTKKDYILIADAIVDAYRASDKPVYVNINTLIGCFIDNLLQENIRFNGFKFRSYIVDKSKKFI